MSHHTYFSTSFKKYLLLSCGLFAFAATTGARDYYVSQSDPHARDFLTNGSEKVPFKTLAAASQVAHAGDTVHILPGVYREILVPVHSGTKDKPIVFQAEGENVWVKGSELIGDWTYESGYWVKRPWHPRYPYDSNAMDVISDAPFQSSARMEQVFVDGMPLQWYPEKKALQSGGFWWAEDGTEIALMLPEGMDANKCSVEIPVREAVVASWPETDVPRTVAEAIKTGESLENQGLPKIDWILIRGIHFAHNISLINRSGVRIQGEHWTLERNTVERMNTNGIQVDNYAVLQGNITRFNGQSGYGAGGGGVDGVIMNGNMSLWDNARLFNNGWGGAGVKFVGTKNFAINNQVVLGAYGSGIWFDWQCHNTCIENCTVISNGYVRGGGAHGGIFLEFSFDAKLENNILFGINNDNGNGPYGAAITLSSTSNIEAKNNVLLLSQGGISILGGPRGGEPPFFATNVSVADNVLLGIQRFPFCLFLPSAFAAESMNQVRGNSVVSSAPGAEYMLDRTGFAGIGAVQEKSNGTMSNNNDIPKLESSSYLQDGTLNAVARRLLTALRSANIIQPDSNGAVSFEAIWDFSSSPSRGILLKSGLTRILLVNNPVPTQWSIVMPKPAEVSIYYSADQKWRQCIVENGKIFCLVPAGLAVIKGLPAEAKAE